MTDEQLKALEANVREADSCGAYEGDSAEQILALIADVRARDLRIERLTAVLESARSQSRAHLSARLGAEGEVVRLQTELRRTQAQVPDAQFTDVLLRNERLLAAEQELRRAIGLALADSATRLSDDVRALFIGLAGPGVSP